MYKALLGVCVVWGGVCLLEENLVRAARAWSHEVQR